MESYLEQADERIKELEEEKDAEILALQEQLQASETKNEQLKLVLKRQNELLDQLAAASGIGNHHHHHHEQNGSNSTATTPSSTSTNGNSQGESSPNPITNGNSHHPPFHPDVEYTTQPGKQLLHDLENGKLRSRLSTAQKQLEEAKKGKAGNYDNKKESERILLGSR